MNHWLKLLQALKNGKFPYYDFGLTPRFIIGACQIPIGEKIETKELAYELTKKMFEEMKAYNQDGKGEYVVISSNCGIHNGKVMNLDGCKWSETSIGTSFEEIWSRYGDEIVEGDYHINKEERKIIEDIYKV